MTIKVHVFITYHYQVTVEYLSFWEYGNPFLIKSAMFIRHRFIYSEIIFILRLNHFQP